MRSSWKNVLIGVDATLRDALAVINAESLRVALVVDSDEHLLGIVTDGDIRRGLLDNRTLAESVQCVMNTKPVTSRPGVSKGSLIQLMESNDILSVPLIENGRIVGLETLHDALETAKHNNPVFIMAGGFGTRLRPLTDTCPKPMLKIGGKPILETLLKSFIKAGFSNFYISTHYMPEIIQDYFGNGSSLGINITYVHEESPLGTGGALGLLPNDLKSDLPIIMMNGDVLTKVDFERLLEFHDSSQAIATMCVREYEYQIPYGVVNGNGSNIISMEEKPVQRFFVNAGIYVVSQELARSVPKNHRIDMPSLLEMQLDDKKDVMMFPIHEYWLDIGRMDDFNRAQADIHSLGFQL